ncbi:MAG TPA: hypothetical protein VN915_01660 [Elusimicrobiota bacterium]|nr:hypothetical protein [Elusimicrobiota bacterium]
MAAQSILHALQGQGLAGGAGIALPAPASTPAAVPATLTSASNSPLTPDVLNRILQLIASKGTDRELVPTVSNPLGLSATGQSWPSRSVGAGHAATDIHGFYISRGVEQDIVITLGIPGKTFSAFRAHRDGKIVSACVTDLQTRQTTMRDPNEAQKDLDTEFALWAGVVGNPTTASN